MLEEKAIEHALGQSLIRMQQRPGAPGLGKAMQYAVFPGGARIRPRLCMAVAKACGSNDEKASISACVSIELIHCASLVHDDLPCFDNAMLRRGKKSTHVEFGQPLAVLAGDSLIIGAFEELATALLNSPHKLAGLIIILAKASGMPAGICSGQGWESEEEIDLSSYHKLKTSSLFAAASQMGALSADQEPEKWLGLGSGIGEAFQIADDLRDFAESQDNIGKPIKQDISNNRPNAVTELGFDKARAMIRETLERAIDSIPPCVGKADLIVTIKDHAKKLMTVGLS